MRIEYGKIKGIPGFVFLVRNDEKIKTIFTFLCEKMDKEHCIKYLASKGYEADKITKVDMSFIEDALKGSGKVKFDDLEIEGLSSFSKKVYQKLFASKAGKLLSYGELSALAGKPTAARVVGSLMRKNPLPLLIPCHRVYAKSGAEHFSITCFNERPKTCNKKSKKEIAICASKIKLAIRDLEHE